MTITDSFGEKAKRTHAIPPDGSEQIEGTGTFGMLPRRDLVADGRVVRQQAFKEARGVRPSGL